jgi:hypothetical protein
MKLYVAPYQLQLKAGWSRNHTGRGALIKLEDNDGNLGYADLHPWDSLGDKNIDEQINLLKLGQRTALSARSIELALVDLEARKNKICLLKSVGAKATAQSRVLVENNIFSTSSNIENHVLVMSLKALKQDLENGSLLKTSSLKSGVAPDATDLIKTSAQKIVKVKIDTSGFVENAPCSIGYLDAKAGNTIIKAEADLLIEIAMKHPEIVFRLDFNEGLSYERFVDFWEHLPTFVKSKIQYCEDPVVWSPVLWKKLHDYGVPLAADRILEQFVNAIASLNANASINVVNFNLSLWKDLLACVQFLVLKPAKFNLVEFLNLIKNVSENVVEDAGVRVNLNANETILAELWPKDIRLVVTSYLDHPVGITHAYIEALKLKILLPEQLDVCGLFSMDAYEKTPFNVIENINAELGTNFKEFSSTLDQSKSSGLEKNNTIGSFGIGFTHLLENQLWTYCGQF